MVVEEIADEGSFGLFAWVLAQVLGPLRFEFGKMIVLAILTPLICILIILTNLLLMFTILRSKKLRSKPFNCYIISMCVSDLLAIEWIVPYVIFYVEHDATLWNTNMHAFFLVVAFLNSMYTVVALSVHRFRAIVQPFEPTFTRRQTIMSILYTWASIVVFTAIYAGIKWHCYPYVHEITRTCPDIRIGKYNAFGFLHLLIIIFGYIIPTLVSGILFGVTAWHLYSGTSSKSTSDMSTSPHEASRRSKARAFKMCVALFLLFISLWSPYWCFMIYWHKTSEDPTRVHGAGTNLLHNLAIFLALCYSWLNLFIYMAFGRELRRGVARTFSSISNKMRGIVSTTETITSSSSSGASLIKAQSSGTMATNTSTSSMSRVYRVGSEDTLTNTGESSNYM